MAKLMTRSEAETKRRRAVEMLKRFGRDEEAERFEGMTAEEYAQGKGAEIISNPNRKERIMAKRKAARKPAELEELEERVAELETEVEDLETELEEVTDERDELAEQVDAVAEAIGAAEEEEEDEEEQGDEDEDEQQPGE